ncbi:hypothetical protein ACFLUH_02825 [Chloroflexota bacterium]
MKKYIVRSGRPKIQPMVKQLIIDKAIKNRKSPRLALAVELKKQIEEMGLIPPTEETMIKMISSARNRELGPEDTRWSMATLERYPISPEALFSVLKVWVYARENSIIEFTVRHAKWAARLSGMIKNTDELLKWSSDYVLQEIFAEIYKIPFSSSELDLELFSSISGEIISSKRRRNILEAPSVINDWELQRYIKSNTKFIGKEAQNERSYSQEV